MKKKLLTAALAGIIASAAFADDPTNVVSSANIVGYVQTEVPASTFSLVANQFISTNGTDKTIGEIFGATLPDGTELYVFDGTYTTYSYVDGMGWVDENFLDAGDILIKRGQSLWIKNTQTSPEEVTFSGDVPKNNSTTNSLLEGFTLISSAYPVSETLLDLNFNAIDGDEIYVFQTGGYVTYSYVDGMGWVDENFLDASNITIDVGVGFWYKTSSSRDWVQAIPYSL